MNFRVLLLWLSVGVAGFATADDVLAPIIVSAPFSAPHVTDPEFAVGQVRVIQRSAFRGHHQSVADVLASVPEVQVQRSGELGSFSSVSVRGAPSRQTLVFVDGVLVPMADGSSLNLAQFSLQDIERIEVYATAPPAQMAQAGIGGAINIVTRKDAERPVAGSVRLTAGSFGTYDTHAQGRWQNGPWQLRGSGFWQQAKNNFPYVFDGGTPQNPDNWERVERLNAGYQAAGGTLGVDHIHADRRRSITVAATHSYKELPTWYNRDIEDTYYKSTQVRGDMEWSEARLLRLPVSASWRLFAQQTDGQLMDATGAISWQGYDVRDQAQMVGLNKVVTGSVGAHLVTLASEVRTENFAVDNRRAQQEYSFSRRSGVFALSDEWYPLPVDLTLLGNVRWTVYEDEAAKEPTTESLFGGHLGVRWAVMSNLVVKANATRFHRVPSLFERYGNQGSFRGNAELEPEQADAWDVSIAGQALGLQWDLGYFQRYSRNAIAPVYNSQGIGRYLNIGDARFQGVEWTLSYPFTWAENDIELSAFGSAQRSRVESPFLAYNGNQVPGYYPLVWGAQLGWTRGRTYAEAEWTHSSGLFYDRANSTQAPDKEYLNLMIRRQLAREVNATQHALEFSVRNVLDSSAMDFNRSPLPGRSYFLSYQRSF